MPWAGAKQIIPAWTKPMLALQYAEPVLSSINGTLESVVNTSINGLVSKRYEFAAKNQEIRLFVVEFTNIGLYSLFRENGSTFTDCSVDAEDLVPTRKRHQICEALSEIRDLDRKVTLVESFLRQFVPDHPPAPARTAQQAIRIMRTSRGRVSIGTVSQRLGLSERHFRRLFHEVTGLPPKTFQRIERFNDVFAAMMGGDEDSLLQLMYDGYFDQSHLIHDFESFAGFSPASVPRENFLMFDVLTAPGFTSRNL
jgi:AraC-like DNA-binding protein